MTLDCVASAGTSGTRTRGLELVGKNSMLRSSRAPTRALSFESNAPSSTTCMDPQSVPVTFANITSEMLAWGFKNGNVVRHSFCRAHALLF